MFATPFTAFHTLLSLAAIVAGACVMSMLVKNRRPDAWTLTFLATMIATDVTGFMFPFDKLLPSHYTGMLSLAFIAVALVAHYAFHFAGAWRWIYAVSMGLAVYLNYFVLVTQLFLKVPAAACAGAERAGQSRAAVPDRAGDRAGDLRLADRQGGAEFPPGAAWRNSEAYCAALGGTPSAIRRACAPPPSPCRPCSACRSARSAAGAPPRARPGDARRLSAR